MQEMNVILILAPLLEPMLLMALRFPPPVVSPTVFDVQLWLLHVSLAVSKQMRVRPLLPADSDVSLRVFPFVTLTILYIFSPPLRIFPGQPQPLLHTVLFYLYLGSLPQTPSSKIITLVAIDSQPVYIFLDCVEISQGHIYSK